MKFKENIICKLLKSLYGLKQSPCEWNHKIDVYFLFKKIVKNFVDHNVYFKKAHKNFYVIITLYVDDLTLAPNDLILLKDNLLKKFEMVDLNEIHFAWCYK
jgi:ATP-binding cassette subfamily B (MDR/TAP) protein 1